MATPVWTKLVRVNSGAPLVGVTSSQGTNEDANGPPADGDGLPLYGLRSYQVELIAPQGQTFTGAGSISFWYHNDLVFDVNAPVDQFPRANETLEDYAGRTTIWLPGKRLNHASGYLIALTKNVGLSGGTTITVRMLGLPE